MRILFVEDEVELNALATGQLERQGHEVISVNCVREAQAIVESADGARLDCVITDHRLPDGFGVAFCVHCRVHHPKLLVAVVSGCLTTKDYALLREYGVPYWVKPVIYSQVATELEQHLPRKNEAFSLEEKMRHAPVLTDGAAGKKSLLRRFFR